MRTVLLDLNSTLTTNFREVYSFHSHKYNVSLEKYRQWLVELLRDEYVILITARTDDYMDETISRIEIKTGWKPQAWYFKPVSQKFLTAHKFKEKIIKQLYGNNIPGGLIALESNADTRDMYKRYGIDAMPVPKGYEWKEIPIM